MADLLVRGVGVHAKFKVNKLSNPYSPRPHCTHSTFASLSSQRSHNTDIVPRSLRPDRSFWTPQPGRGSIESGVERSLSHALQLCFARLTRFLDKRSLDPEYLVGWNRNCCGKPAIQRARTGMSYFVHVYAYHYTQPQEMKVFSHKVCSFSDLSCTKFRTDTKPRGATTLPANMHH